TYLAIPSGIDDSHHTTVQAATGETVTLNGVDGLGGVVAIYNGSYITLDGLTLDGVNSTSGFVLFIGGDPGIYSHDITVQDGVVRNKATGGSFACITQTTSGGANSHVIFRNMEVYNCGAMPTLPVHGIYLTAAYSTIENCTIHDNEGYGIHQYTSS